MQHCSCLYVHQNIKKRPFEHEFQNSFLFRKKITFLKFENDIR